MAFAFEKLLVCQKAVVFVDTVCTLTKGFPRGYFFLADQIDRADPSIAANIAEGNGLERHTGPVHSEAEDSRAAAHEHGGTNA